MPYTSRQAAAYGVHVAPQTVRRVWVAVTRRPTATVRDLADALGLAYSVVAAALRMLRDAGYIDFDPGTARARCVIVPFIVTIAKPPPEGGEAQHEGRLDNRRTVGCGGPISSGVEQPPHPMHEET